MRANFELNTLGESDERAQYRTALVDFLTAHKSRQLEEDQKSRLG